MRELIRELMLIPGLSGHEDRVRRAIESHLTAMDFAPVTDRLGNLSLSLSGDDAAPRVMVFTHMDQLGFVVRKIEADGLIAVERLGGVPERALAAQAVVIATERRDIPAVIGIKSHHATSPEEKYVVPRYPDLRLDAGFASKDEAEAAGVKIGSPVTYHPRVIDLSNGRLAGTAVDDRAGCAALIALAERRRDRPGPPLTLVWSVQEEFNLRGVLPAARAVRPDIALQIDLLLACDTPDMAARGDVRLGGGPGIATYSFHGRGTLNGVIPHPALVRLFKETADAADLPLQRSAHTGALTDLSYIQFEGTEGVACLDVGFPMRYSHSALEVVDVGDVEAMVDLIDAALDRIRPGFGLTR